MVTGVGRWEEREKLNKREKKMKHARREQGRLESERDERARWARHLRDKRREVERMQAERDEEAQRQARDRKLRTKRERQLRDPLLRHLIAEFNREHDVDLSTCPEAVAKIRGLCSDVRHALKDASVDTVPVAFDVVLDPAGSDSIDFRTTVSRSVVDMLTAQARQAAARQWCLRVAAVAVLGAVAAVVVGGARVPPQLAVAPAELLAAVSLPQWADPLSRWPDAAVAGIACGALALGALMGFRRIQSYRRQSRARQGDSGTREKGSSPPKDAARSQQSRRNRRDDHEVSRRRQLTKQQEEMRIRARERKLEIERLQDERRRRNANSTDVGELIRNPDGSFVSVVQTKARTASFGGEPKGDAPQPRRQKRHSKRLAQKAKDDARPAEPAPAPKRAGPGTQNPAATTAMWTREDDAAARRATASALQVLDDDDDDDDDDDGLSLDGSVGAGRSDGDGDDGGNAVGEMMRQERAERERIAKEMNVPEDCICPLTLEVMRDPVIDALGHSYEVRAPPARGAAPQPPR